MWPPFKRVTTSRTIVCFVALLANAAVASACTLFRNPYIDRELSGPVTLNGEWLELVPKEPLKVEHDTQEVTLFPDPPIKMVDDPAGKRSLIPSDGRDADI